MTAAGRPRVDGVTDSMFAPVAVARASSAIAEQIRTAILSGRLKAGDRLSPERELAEQFGVSRVTVRDALRSLEAMGLIAVKVGARGGAFVTAPTGSKVAQTMSDMMMMSATTPEDIVEARLVVELGTVTLACARSSTAMEAPRATRWPTICSGARLSRNAPRLCSSGGGRATCAPRLKLRAGAPSSPRPAGGEPAASSVLASRALPRRSTTISGR